MLISIFQHLLDGSKRNSKKPLVAQVMTLLALIAQVMALLALLLLIAQVTEKFLSKVK